MWYEHIIWTGLCVLPCCTGLILEWILLAVAVPTTAAGIAVTINSIIVIVVIIVSPWRYTVRQ